MKQLIYQIKSVRLFWDKSNPPKLEIECKGLVRTGGWSEPQLETRIKGLSPEGYMHFNFLAKPPSGIVIQVISDIAVKHIVDNVPEGIKGVVVFAEDNSVTKLL